MRARLPEGMNLQCPACGAPVETVEFGRTPDDAGYGLRLAVQWWRWVQGRDAWGLPIPEPDPLSVRYAPATNHAEPDDTGGAALVDP